MNIIDINDAEKVVGEFLKKTLKANNVKLTKTARIGDGWEAEAEVYEESSFIKSLGLPTRVQDRNLYLVKLNSILEVESFERKGLINAGE
jgi:hypothetical protein